MGKESFDSNGNLHDKDGRFVELRDYVERIFDEREKASEFVRQTSDRALIEAKASTERALLEAKSAADARDEQLQRRIEKLESGGAPFASRLDDGLKELKRDVDTLKDNMVRTTALEELRKANTTAIESQRKSIKFVFLAAGVSFALSLVLVLLRVLTGIG